MKLAVVPTQRAVVDRPLFELLSELYHLQNWIRPRLTNEASAPSNLRYAPQRQRTGLYDLETQSFRRSVLRPPPKIFFYFIDIGLQLWYTSSKCSQRKHAVFFDQGTIVCHDIVEPSNLVVNRQRCIRQAEDVGAELHDLTVLENTYFSTCGILISDCVHSLYLRDSSFVDRTSGAHPASITRG